MHVKFLILWHLRILWILGWYIFYFNCANQGLLTFTFIKDSYFLNSSFYLHYIENVFIDKYGTYNVLDNDIENYNLQNILH